MATPDDQTRWISQTGIWAVAASWSDGIPSSSIQPKTATFDGTSQHDVYTVGASGTCQRLVTKPEYYGNIASSGDPFEILAEGFTILRGRGEHHLKFDAGDFATVILDTLRGQKNTIDGVIGRLCVRSGDMDVKRTADLTSQLWVSGRNSNVYIPAQEGAELAPVLTVITGGELEFWRSLPANSIIVAMGGRVTWRGVLSDDTTLIKGPGGVFTYNPISEPVTNPMVVFAQGRFDLTQLNYPFGVTQAIIGPTAELDGGTLTAFGPTTAFADPVDLRLEYP